MPSGPGPSSSSSRSCSTSPEPGSDPAHSGGAARIIRMHRQRQEPDPPRAHADDHGRTEQHDDNATRPKAADGCGDHRRDRRRDRGSHHADCPRVHRQVFCVAVGARHSRRWSAAGTSCPHRFSCTPDDDRPSRFADSPPRSSRSPCRRWRPRTCIATFSTSTGSLQWPGSCCSWPAR